MNPDIYFPANAHHVFVFSQFFVLLFRHMMKKRDIDFFFYLNSDALSPLGLPGLLDLATLLEGPPIPAETCRLSAEEGENASLKVLK